jgi:putative addiction module killer protein
MNTILRTETFDKWLRKLKDARGKARIIDKIRSAERGNFSDCKAVGQGVWEMRIHFGPGYRVYYSRIGPVIFILLCGGKQQCLTIYSYIL